ncbi:MAG: hypothetical protein ACXVCV_26050, partial [Polyangia bacterium]
CVFGSSGAAGCCDSAADCPTPTAPCLAASCIANQCAEAPIVGCTDDGGVPIVPDLAEAPDLSAAVTLSGGGGCALAGARSSSPAALRGVLLLFVVRARRRRAA